MALALDPLAADLLAGWRAWAFPRAASDGSPPDPRRRVVGEGGLAQLRQGRGGFPSRPSSVARRPDHLPLGGHAGHGRDSRGPRSPTPATTGTAGRWRRRRGSCRCPGWRGRRWTAPRSSAGSPTWGAARRAAPPPRPRGLVGGGRRWLAPAATRPGRPAATVELGDGARGRRGGHARGAPRDAGEEVRGELPGPAGWAARSTGKGCAFPPRSRPAGPTRRGSSSPSGGRARRSAAER